MRRLVGFPVDNADLVKPANKLTPGTRKFKMLKQRIITAVLLIAPFLATLFYLPHVAMTAIFGLVTVLAAREWAILSQLRGSGVTIYASVVVLLGLLIIYFKTSHTWALVLALIFWSVVFYLIRQKQQNPERTVPRWMLLFSGLAVLPLCWLSLEVLLQQPGGRILILMLFLTIWTADSGAYFIGRAFGRRKLADNISPGKSIEGAIGGLLLVLPISWIMAKWVLGLSLLPSIIWALAMLLPAIYSIAGDLFESIIKRQAGVKDSGNLLPGHGGIMDRCDSVFAAAPVFSLIALGYAVHSA